VCGRPRVHPAMRLGGRTATVAGLDLGTLDATAGVVTGTGVQLVQNEVSKRQTPAVVAFGGRKRFVGDEAAAVLKTHGRNACRGFKHLLGRKADSPEMDTERFWSLAPITPCGRDGFAGYSVTHKEEQKQLSATAVLAMFLSKMVALCEKWTNLGVSDIVLSIPSYFSDTHRMACLDAIKIAGLTCLQLLHESTAIALAWWFTHHRTDDLRTIPTQTVVFCHAGHSALLVAVVRYSSAGIEVIGETICQEVSGREMDRALMQHAAKAFVKSGGEDPLQEGRWKPRLKLEEAVRKAKHVLSSVNQASVSVECLDGENDLSTSIQRDTFEQLCSHMVAATQRTVSDALATANVVQKEISAVEICGGASRCPWLQSALQSCFPGLELRKTLNADECVAIGCGWQAAMSSPLYKLQQLDLVQYARHYVCLDYPETVKEASESPDTISRVDRVKRMALFQPRAGLNVEVELTFSCASVLNLVARYQDASTLLPGTNTRICDFAIAVGSDPSGPTKMVQVIVVLDCHGIVSISSAAMVEAPEGAAGDDTFNWKFWEWGQEGSGNPKKKTKSRSQGDSGRVRKTLNVVSARLGGLQPDDLQQAIAADVQMRKEDFDIRAAEDRRNDLEAKVFGLQDKLSSSLASKMGPKELEQLQAELSALETWTCEHDAEEQSEYTTRYKDLDSKERSIAGRQSLAEMAEGLRGVCTACEKLLQDPATAAHISIDARQSLEEQYKEAMACVEAGAGQWEAPDIERFQTALEGMMSVATLGEGQSC